MEFLKRFFPSSKPGATAKPPEGDAFRKRVRENSIRDLTARKEILSETLHADPPLHPAKLLYTLQKLSQAALQLAMLDWRAGVDPRPHMSEIKDSLDSALTARPDILPGEQNPGFMAIVSDMMGWNLPFNSKPPSEDELDNPMIWMDRWIIAELYDPSCWSEKSGAPSVKNQFINRCLSDYWALLTEQVDPEKGVKRCITNYERRATHQTFKNLPSLDAGGKYNAIFVDYTLAAIMKKRRIKIGTVHAWVWD